MEDLTKAKTIRDVSSYVQNTARYYKDAPMKKYAVRYPNQYGSRCVFSDDTHDLVLRLCRIYKIRIPRGESATT